MRRHTARGRVRLAALVAVGLAAAVPAAAQARPDTGRRALFHAGQWGAEFTGAPQLRTVGVLRFTSPRSAWLVDGSISAFGGRARRENPGPGERPRLRNHSASLMARVGRRRYAPLSAAAVRFAGAGLMGEWQDNRYQSDLTDARTRRWGAGVFGELGASYLVTSHLGLGLTVSASAVYRQARDESGIGTPNVSRNRELTVYAAPFALAATFYF